MIRHPDPIHLYQISARSGTLAAEVQQKYSLHGRESSPGQTRWLDVGILLMVMHASVDIDVQMELLMCT